MVNKKSFYGLNLIFSMLLLSLSMFVFVLVFASSNAEASFETNRIYGQNRYTTAVNISREGWPEGSSTVVIARGDDYADALTGVPLAYSHDAPILLTPTNYLHEDTKNEIVRLGASKAIIVGGTAAISENVLEEIISINISDINRIAGTNRFDTAALIAKEFAPEGAETAVIAYGYNFPDALAVASFAAKQGFPILLTSRDELPASTGQALDVLGVKNTIIVGGTSVISNNVANQLPAPTRVAGANRYETAIEIARHFNASADHFYVATGLGFADAIAGGVLAAKEDSGILLVGANVTSVVRSYLKEKNIKSLTIFGGPAAVSHDVEADLSGFVVHRFSGRGKDYTNLFDLESGLLVIESTHDGSSNFIVKLLDHNGEWVELVANEIGPHNGQRVFNVDKGRYLFDIDADGNWDIVVKQPRPTEILSPPVKYTGNGEMVTDFLRLEGLTTFNMKHSGSRNFIVILRDDKGNWKELLANEIGSYTGNKAVGVEKGTYIIGIRADGNWEIEIK